MGTECIDLVSISAPPDAMVAHPILIQRPIVIRGGRAVIARPAEPGLELLDGVD